LSCRECHTTLPSGATGERTSSTAIRTELCSWIYWLAIPCNVGCRYGDTCLMSNHFHLVAVPIQEDAAAKVLGRLESDYARFLNVRRRTSGHLWQARYHSVAMEAAHCWRTLAYIERNPVRAGMTSTATDYPWSSAAARVGFAAVPAWLDLDPWSQHWTTTEWLCMLADGSEDDSTRVDLQGATLSGYPMGKGLVERPEKKLNRRLRRGKAGRPPKERADSAQGSFF
jgi:putative transposase